MATIKESIGPTPCDEDCAQTVDADFSSKNRAECLRFLGQLQRLFPTLPEGMSFCTVVEQHEFGTYREVGVKFDSEREDHWEMFKRIENGLPTHWDETAKAEM